VSGGVVLDAGQLQAEVRQELELLPECGIKFPSKDNKKEFY